MGTLAPDRGWWGGACRPPEPFHYGFRTGRTTGPCRTCTVRTKPDIPDITVTDSAHQVPVWSKRPYEK